jgi:Fe-S cluster assembly protein SufD
VSTADVLDRLLPDTPVRDEPARRWLATHGWPSNHEEAWRYAPLDAIARVSRTLVDDAGAGVVDLLPAQLERLATTHPAWAPGAVRLVLVDGRPIIDWSSTPDALAAAGLVVLTGVAPEPFRADERANGFDALNLLTTPGVTTVEVTEAEEPHALHLVHLATTQQPTSPSRTRLVVGPGVILSVTETFESVTGESVTGESVTGESVTGQSVTDQSVTGAGLTIPATSLRVGARARVEHVRVVSVGRGGAHVGSTSIVAHEGARIRSGALQLGPGPVRHSVAADLVGDDAAVELRGLSLPGAGGHHDTDVSVRHLAAAGTSRQHFVGVVPDRARVSFGGHVVVAAATTGTDADQQSRNLLLGPTARADARPWLEICSDDVRCTHGAAVGRLDDDGLFYLRTRGIGVREARAMLLRAFVATVLDELAEPGATADWLTIRATDAIDELLRSPTTRPDQGAATR